MTPNYRIARRILLAAFCFQTAFIANGCQKSNNSIDSAPVHNSAQSEEKTAKNVIIFIGDGMGVSTVTAARIFDGQSKGMKGEEHSLSFESFDNVALIKTYNTNSQVPDSAGTATAILSGYKTNIGTVNVPADLLDARSSDVCNPAALPPTLTDKAKSAGKSVGIISTARITHATPAAVYGHAPSRSLEADKDIEGPFVDCTSLSQQLLDSNVDIALGGGLKEFTPEQLTAWKEKEGNVFVETSKQMLAAPQDGRLFGFFNKSHMAYEADRAGSQEPSLAEMTTLAMQRLSQNESGYVLMVEAGRVDHAHHGTNAYRALRDMQALNEAVATAVEQAGDDTLIMVTADHSHVFTMSGYPVRGNPILGLVKGPNYKTREFETTLDEDGKPFTTLGYHNGPNVREADSPALTDNMVQAEDYRQQTAVRLGSETHGGEDVPLYATGPGAEHVKGVMEQDEIGKLIADVISTK